MYKHAILMRGIPGSGKSTVADYIAGRSREPASIFSADSFHVVDGRYKWDSAKLAWAHDRCFEGFTRTAVDGKRKLLIVDNTNVTWCQMAPYVRVAEVFGYEVSIVEMHCSILDSIKRNVHDVPEETICNMAMQMSRPLPEYCPNVYGVKSVWGPDEFTAQYGSWVEHMFGDEV